MELSTRHHASSSNRFASATPTSRSVGVALAGLTATVSGVSVFVNGYGVRRFDDATTYTTAKNLIAALVITSLLLVKRRASRSRRRDEVTDRPVLPRHQLVGAWTAVAVIGGSVPFVLFFEGLSRASSTDAAFIHKTLVVWVAALATTFLHERIGGWHVAAIVALMWGQAALSGGVGMPDLGTAELLILAATLCWAVEVVIARYVLQRGADELALGTARMLGGFGLLLLWAVIRGTFGDLATLRPSQWGWALLTGAFLSGYVVSWHFALRRAQAVDVTAVLVVGAAITALLNAGVQDIPLRPTALVLLGLGGVLVTVGVLRTDPSQAVS